MKQTSASFVFSLLIALTPAWGCATNPSLRAGQRPAGESAQTSARPVLFVASDADTKVYLFGTIHFLDGNRPWFERTILEAFEESGQLVLEMVPPDQAVMQKVMLEKAFDPSGKPLSQTLSPEAWEALKAKLEASGLPVAAFEPMDPWLVALTLTAMEFGKFGFSPESGVEAVLTRAARESKKPIRGLETFEEQMDLFDGLPEEDQVAFLNAAVEQTSDAEVFIRRMVKHWSEGDTEALAAIVLEGMADESLRKRLLTDRNARWADTLAELMNEQAGTLFVAVGAGHLGGEGSLQEALSRHGIKVTRIGE